MEKKLRIFDLDAVRTESDTGDGVTIPAEHGFEIGVGVHKGTIRGIVWTLDHNIIVTVADDRLIRWWSLATRSVVQEYGVNGDFGSCEFTTVAQTQSGIGNGMPVLVITAGKEVLFFGGVAARTHLKTITFPYDVASAALHPDQRKLVTGHMRDTWAKVYDYDTEQEIGMLHTSL
jgi:serine-threonine kinase receptor-associated protein